MAGFGLELHTQPEHPGAAGQLFGDARRSSHVVEVVFTQVDHRDDRLGRQQEVRLQERAVLVGEPGAADGWAPCRCSTALRGRRASAPSDLSALAALRRFSSCDSALAASASTSSSSSVVRSSSGSASRGRCRRGRLGARKIASTSRRPPRNRLPRPSPRRSPLQSGDVDDLRGGVHHLLRAAHLGQRADSGVRNGRHADVGLRRRVGMSGDRRAATREGVEER